MMADSPSEPPSMLLFIEKDFTISAGEEKEMVIELTNPFYEITMVQFDLYLPQGLSLKKENGDYVYDIAGRTTWKNHSLDANAMGDYIRFILISSKNIALSGTSGAIISMTIVADASFNGGEIVLDGIVLASPNEEQIKLDAYKKTIPPSNILVNKISLNQTSTTLNVGETLQLTATVSPTNATDKSVSWTSSNTNVATVSNTGLVTAVAAGTATITCKAHDGSGVTATCSVTVIKQNPPTPSNATLSIEPFNIKVGKEKEIFIDLSNPDDEITMVQFDLSLPKGLSLKKQGGDYVYDIAGRTSWKNHSLDANCIGDVIRFILISNKNSALSGNSGAIIKMTIVADAGFNGGDIVLDNIVLAKPDETQIKPDKVVYSVPSPGSSPDPDPIKEGKYYLRNVASGLFITNGGNWGTHIAVDKRGLDMWVVKANDGKHYNIISGFISNINSEGALGTEGYVDNYVGIDLEITKISEGVYTIKADNGFLLTTNDKNNLADFEGESASDKKAQWEFIDKDVLFAHRLESLFKASATNPVDATFLMENANINGFKDLRVSAWKRSFGNAYCNSGCPLIDTEPIMEIFRNGDIMCSNPFSIIQTITLFPGYYKLEAQGFYRDGGYSDATTRRTNGEEQIDAYLFAADKQIPLKSIFDDATSDREKWGSIKTTYGYIPNTMAEAGYAFQSGLYNNELYFNIPEEMGQMSVEIGIRGDESFHYNNWTAFDNFQLTYYGDDNPSPNKPVLIAEDGIIDIDHNVNPGMLRINLDNPGVAVYGFSFTVNLPEHVSIESAELSRRCEGDKWEIDFYNIPGSSTSRVVCYNLASEPIKDESGLLCTLMLKADQSTEDGTHACSIRAIELTSKDASGSYPIYPEDATFNLTIVNDIETITMGEDTSQPVYTLQGIRTTSPKRGIYIRNGKKVVVK